MRGIRRAKGARPWKSSILTPLLHGMVVALPDDLPGLRDKALPLIGFASHDHEARAKLLARAW